MAFCSRCAKEVWFPCKNEQSELSCKHKRESGSSPSFDSPDVDVEPVKSSGGFLSAVSDAFSNAFSNGGGYDGGSCGGGDCGGGGD